MRTPSARPPPRSAGVLLIFQRGPCPPTPHRVERPLRFGRSEEADVMLDDAGVSRLHILLEPAPNGLAVTDLGSRNGTFLDRAPLDAHKTFARFGSILRLGGTLLRALDNVIPFEAQVANPYPALIGGAALQPVRAGIALAAASPMPALIEGETGTGKEVIARSIHEASARAGRFVAVNCAALAPELVESELFGHVRGSFSGATGSRPGLFRTAHRGTLLLDEVGELPLPIQAKLLRVVETGEVRGIGEDEPTPVDVRILAATNRDLNEMVAANTFRRDLLHRIAVARIKPPPLRDRLEDIPLLLAHFLADDGTGSAASLGASAGALELMLAHAWSGNVRELRNVARAGAAAARRAGRDELEEEDVALLLPALEPAPMSTATPADSQRSRIVAALTACDGNVSRATQELGMARSAFYEALKRFGLEPATFRKR